MDENPGYERRNDVVIAWGGGNETGTHVTVMSDGSWHQTVESPKWRVAQGNVNE